MTRPAARRNVGQYFAAAFLLGASTFALAYKPTDEAVSKMQPHEARREVEDLLKTHFVTTHTGAIGIQSVVLSTERMALQIRGEEPRVFRFKDFPALEVKSSIVYPTSLVIGNSRQTTFFAASGGDRFDLAVRVANALHRLKLESIRAADPAAELAFAEVAGRYRVADPKPEFPQEARRLRVQAEAMLRDRRFLDAVDLYGEALSTVPWWPEGRFNRGLVLGELNDFDAAVREMKRYLLLAPDAPNAADAQDRIYEWEGKARRR